MLNAKKKKKKGIGTQMQTTKKNVLTVIQQRLIAPDLLSEIQGAGDPAGLTSST